MTLPRRRFLQLVAGAAVALPACRARQWHNPIRRSRCAGSWGFRPAAAPTSCPASWGLAVRAARPASRHREQARRRHQYLDPGRGRLAARRLHAAVHAASSAVNVTFFETLPFNLVRDIAPVAGLIDFPLVLVAHPCCRRRPRRADRLAKANPGTVNIASFGTGTTSHLAGELFKMMAGVNIVHVPYRGGAPMITDLIAGQVEVGIRRADRLAAAHPVGRAAGARRGGQHALRRRCPTCRRSARPLPGYEANSWCGVGVPSGTPPEIIARLNREINAGLADPHSQGAARRGRRPRPILFTPAEFGA